MILTAGVIPACRIFDANGVEYKYIKSVNTITGEAQQYAVDDAGRYIIAQPPLFDSGIGIELETNFITLPTPIRVEFIE